MPMSVLIVDDHPSFRDAARLLLEASGYVVVGEAGDAESALVAARTLRPDVVILDIQLPDRDGFAVAAELTAEAKPPRIVLVSGRAAREYGRRLPAAGTVGFIHKAELSRACLASALGTVT